MVILKLLYVVVSFLNKCAFSTCDLCRNIVRGQKQCALDDNRVSCVLLSYLLVLFIFKGHA